jgi:RNA polymerase sigma-70 factor, ECF subfamily
VTDRDAAYLAAAARGDGEAFSHIVDAHERAVYRFVQSLGLRGADADDALQETFIAAWRGAGRFRGEGSARSWLLAIARNVVRHATRRHVGEPADFEPLDDIALAAGWGRDPLEDVAARQRADLVHAALARLSPEDREILVLRELEDLSGDDTAAALGLSLAAMKSRLHRARLRLTAALRAALPEDDRHG